MRELSGWWKTTTEDYPDRLIVGAGDPLRARWGLMAVLVLVCLLPRAWEAWHRNQLWTDSITFHEASLALERGEYHEAFKSQGVNLYSLILWGLRATGWNWEVSAKWWSVVLGTLAVLPLFGWVRRQFDDTVATTACLLYAIHGKLAAVSSLVIRDATFWFLFLLTIYLAWRAVVELRWRFFLLAGMALTLSIHLRSEGWLLIVAIVLWATFRCLAARDRWKRVALGTVLCLAVIPASVALLNLTALRSAPQWGFFRADQVELVKQSINRHLWPKKHAGGENGAAESPATATPPQMAPPSDIDHRNLAPNVTVGKNLRTLGLLLVKAYTYIGGLLALMGIAVWCKVYYRRDHQTLAVMSLLLLAIIWIRSFEGRSDMRYFLPMVLVSFPWLALGFLSIPMLVMQRTQAWVDWTPRRSSALVAALAVAVLVPNSFDLRVTSGEFMDGHVAVGRWIATEYGPGKSIYANIEERRLLQYYSQSKYPERFSVHELDAGRLPGWLTASPPDVILVWIDPCKDAKPFNDFAAAVLARKELGYHRVPTSELPPVCSDVILLSRIR